MDGYKNLIPLLNSVIDMLTVNQPAICLVSYIVSIVISSVTTTTTAAAISYRVISMQLNCTLNYYLNQLTFIMSYLGMVVSGGSRIVPG